METTIGPDTSTYGNIAPLPRGDVETRLEMSRAMLRHRLLQARADDQTGIWGHINDVTGQVAPIARQYVRHKPLLSLAAAALAGAFVVRFKPWRALGGPILLGILARQALAMTVSRSSHLLGSLLTGTGKSKKDRFSES
ncbi:MAG: hypothetical protein IV085_05970 [Thiobacillus sp.]|nr:hypothetical protein [Thiobacillus sp.]